MFFLLVFLFFFNFPPRRDAQCTRAYTVPRAYTRGHSQGQSRSPSSNEEEKNGKKRERKRYSWNGGGKKRERERKTGDGRARESEGPRQVRRRERESACCSEALYPPVERELGAQCYDGHQADRSQPLSASSAVHVSVGPPPSISLSVCLRVRPRGKRVRTSRLIALN